MTGDAKPSSIPDRRKSRIIDRAFQYKYTLMAVAFTLVISLTYMTMVYLEHFEIQKEIGIYCNATVATELLQKSTSIIGYIFLGTLLISLLLTGLGIVATHRIAGPIFVINRYLTVLANGRIPTMRPLRKHDELQTLYGNLRGVVEMLSKREKEEAERLKRAVDILRPAASSREAQECLEGLRAMYQRKREAVDASEPLALEAVEEAA